MLLPETFTPPLSDDFTTDGDALLRLVELVWRLPDGSPLVLDEWQRWLIRRVLETYPPGHRRAGQLRFRQVVVSIPRQAGKSLLGAIFGLYGLLREAGALVIGLASSADQANIIFSRTLGVIRSSPELNGRFTKLTETRGITSSDGSRYLIKPAKSAAVQGLDLSLGLFDELHIARPELWGDAVTGTAARRNGIVIGLTTAGDSESELLIRLYGQGEAAAKATDSRFGFFRWQAPVEVVPEEDNDLRDALLAANPAIECGRLDVEVALADLKTLPAPEVLRYRFNRMLNSAESSFVPASLWLKAARRPEEEFPAGRPVFAIDRSPDWGYATITASVKDEHGVIWSEMVASIVKPTLEQLVDVCVRLSKHNPVAYAADSYSLKPLLEELKRHGHQVFTATLGDVTGASALFYSLLSSGRLRHADEPLLAQQIPRTVRKNVGDAFRVSRKDSSVAIDAVISTMLGAYVVETFRAPSIPVF